MKFICSYVLAAFAVVGVIDGTVLAADPAVTTITVEKMHCAGCGKRIAGKLYQVPGVKEVRVDVKAKTLIVAGGNPSPRALWEAVEKANDRPLSLMGPQGSFKEKPQS